MFGAKHGGANAYSAVGMETGVVAASPHKLIVMLFDGAITALNNAAEHINAADIPAKGSAISKALSIIDSGLRASLDKQAGGQIADNLDALYDYMGRRLVAANLHNDLQALDEVRALLRELRGAWESIGAAPAPAAAALQAAPVYDALAPRSSTFASA